MKPLNNLMLMAVASPLSKRTLDLIEQAECEEITARNPHGNHCDCDACCDVRWEQHGETILLRMAGRVS